MLNLFLSILNMSISASWLILAVLLLRYFLKKAPKFITWILWGMIAFRLFIPFSIESMYSFIPSVQTVPQDIIYSSEPVIYSGIEFVDSMINPLLSNDSIIVANTHIDIMELVVNIACLVWLIGVFSMFIYSVVSYIKLKRQVSASLHFKDNIYFCDDISVPFILGVLNPKIYVPSYIEEEYLVSVLAHENAHLKRKDHIWKAFGFFLLSLHWFNPLAWVAYVLFGRDIEVACDELAIMEMQDETKKEYCEALVSLSEQKRILLICPLAFGEINVKERIKMIANYKKPAFWIIMISCALCMCACVGFGSNPMSNNTVKLIEVKEDKTFKDILDHTNFIEVGSDENSYTCIYDEDREEILDVLRKVEVKKDPVSDDHSRDRIKSKFIYLGKTDGTNIKLYFDDEYDKVWIDTNSRTSLTYEVVNKELLDPIYVIFESDYKDRPDSMQYNTTDGYVTEVKDDCLVLQSLWHGSKSIEMIIKTKTSENGNPLFRKYEYLRIIGKKHNTHTLSDNKEVTDDFEKIVYLNKVRITSDIGNSAYYTPNQIHKAMEAIYNKSLHHYDCSWIHYYYDEAKAMELLKTRYGDMYSIDEKMVIFSKALSSRRLYAQKYFSMEVEDYGYSVEDSDYFSE